MRRVVVTGMGLVSPLGIGVDHVWQRIINGETGIDYAKRVDLKGIPVSIVGQVPAGTKDEGKFSAEEWIDPKEIRRNGTFIIYGMAAADMAVADSGFTPKNEDEQFRSGVIIGSGVGGLPEIEHNSLLTKDNPRKVSPFFIPSSLINLISGQVSIKYGLKGPNHAIVTACATGTHAIGDAARIIACGDADVMVAGGAESTISPVGINGFARMNALSSKYEGSDKPYQASRPWDKGRDGFVMGEGAGVLVLEEYEHAKARGAKIYGEVVGYGLSGDASHITSPAEDGNGAYRCMKMALDKSGLKVEDIGYINAHGTSTPVGDVIELKAIRRLFGDSVGNVSISSTKSAIGHLLGAAGAVEAIFSLKALNEGVIPPTLNLEDPTEEALGLDLVPNKAKKKELKAVLSNSFGFGGTNSSIIFKKV